MSGVVKSAVDVSRSIHRIYFQITRSSYEKELAEPKDVVVEARDNGVWVGIKGLDDVAGPDEDGYHYRILLEYVSEEEAAELKLTPGWRVQVWADGDDEEPQTIYLTAASRARSMTHG